MAKESPVFAERFALVSSPQQYYTVVAFLDLLEFLFRLHKRKNIDPQLWLRWKELAKTLMTIPKFKIVWENTKFTQRISSNLLIRFNDKIGSERLPIFLFIASLDLV
jgi:hypothetical protein